MYCYLEEAKAKIPELKNLPTKQEPYRSLIEKAAAIENFPRGLSIHCAGVVIAPKPITNYVPLERASKGFVVTQFDMYPVEDMGLVKIDILGQKGLAVMSETVFISWSKDKSESPLRRKAMQRLPV